MDLLPDDNLEDTPTSKRRKQEENDGVSICHDDLLQIIQPFTHEQLSQIVITACLRHQDVFETVRSLADRDQSQRNLYIRGLNSETTTGQLTKYFSRYGEVVEAVAVTDKVTGKGKGFGFITFKHIDSALRALRDPSKIIDDKLTFTRLACDGFVNNNNNKKWEGKGKGKGKGNVWDRKVYVGNVWDRKVYVGNVGPEMDCGKMLERFETYGEVEEGPVGFDKGTGKFKGFAFIVYKNVEGAKACLVDPVKVIDGQKLHCRMAVKKGNVAAMEKSVTASQVEATANKVCGFGGDGVKSEEVVDSNQQSKMEDSFGLQSAGGSCDNGGSSGGLGGLVGGAGQRPSLVCSPNPLMSRGSGLFSFGRNDGGPGMSTNGGQAPIGGGNGTSHFGGFGTSYGGMGSDGEVGPGHGANYGGTRNGEGVELGTGFGAPSLSYGGIGTGGVGLGIGFGGSSHISHYGLSPGYARMSYEGYSESAHYSLSSGSTDQAQPQNKNY